MAEAATAAAPVQPYGRLALILQETLTAIVRIRAGRDEIHSADAFRAQIERAMQIADQEGRRAGYNGEDMRLAIYAVVAFLDETVLKANRPVFADWPRQPLGLKWFKGHVAGDTFFVNLKDLLQGDDSARVADLLEVHQLCLLLGYRGRYASDREGDVRAIIDRISEKIRRIRGDSPLLAPSGGLPGDTAVRQADRLSRTLMIVAALLASAALVLFLVYRGTLSSAVSGLQGV